MSLTLHDTPSARCRSVALMVAAALFAGACTTPSSPYATPSSSPVSGPVPRGSAPAPQASQDQLGVTWRILICGIGGGLGYMAGKEVSKRQSKPNKNTAITLALLGCVGADALAGTVYAKLSENGRRAREIALLEAARSGRVQTYRDDQAPTLTGTVTPGPRNRDAAGSLCVTNTDYLADRGKGENVYVKMCQQADGGWAPAVS
ncbi:MAG TPA: hypothetical protein PLP92_08970 [Rhodocyclaceae bacterium]|nr:hypothetical protein [Rhodocyclaceae bacterium]